MRTLQQLSPFIDTRFALHILHLNSGGLNPHEQLLTINTLVSALLQNLDNCIAI